MLRTLLAILGAQPKPVPVKRHYRDSADIDDPLSRAYDPKR